MFDLTAVCLCLQTLELIGLGADVNRAESDGWTPLLFAANNGHLDVVGLLLEAGASVGARAERGVTALKVAREGGFEEVVELLQGHGAGQEAEEDEWVEEGGSEKVRAT